MDRWRAIRRGTDEIGKFGQKEFMLIPQLKPGKGRQCGKRGRDDGLGTRATSRQWICQITNGRRRRPSAMWLPAFKFIAWCGWLKLKGPNGIPRVK